MKIFVEVDSKLIIHEVFLFGKLKIQSFWINVNLLYNFFCIIKLKAFEINFNVIQIITNF
jgi:hypothetical protein